MFNKNASSLNELHARLIIEELKRLSIDCFYISPGSRSTPLTAAVAVDEDINPHIHFDERSAAFAALGYVRATGKPSVLICTSGTATANYFPALVEAMTDTVPLIILTADRPPELHNVGANQTIEQEDMYGDFVKSSINIEPPDKTDSSAILLSTIDDAVFTALENPQGPVHINLMFREPLAPFGRNTDFSSHLKEIKSWFSSGKPFSKKKSASKNRNHVDEIIDKIDNKNPAIIIAGALKSNKEQRAIISFAEKMNLPVFTDIRSGLRLSCSSKNIIPYYDQLLLMDLFKKIKGLIVFHFGGNVVSKRFLETIESADIGEYISVHDGKMPYNPHHKMTLQINKDISSSVKDFSKNLKPFNKKFLVDLQKQNAVVEKVLQDNENSLNEITIARTISQKIKKNSTLFLASSMPVRDFDMYADPNGATVHLASNRGVSGIDGTIASAVGFSAGHKKRGTVVIGDLAFLHDLNSLALVRQSFYPITIVIINNNGGGIFSFLPIAKNKEIFEPFFGTPHDFTFEHAAAQFEISYASVNTLQEFKRVYKYSQKTDDSLIIEISTNRKDNFAVHQKLQDTIKNALKKKLS